MNSPIIHIGYHKTATSWFQKDFYLRVANASYVGRNLVRKAFLNTTAFMFDPDGAAKLLKTEKRPIICDEDLCGHYDNGGLLESLSMDMARRIHSVYPDAQIIIFVRNQLDMIRSTYLQYVRGGGTYSLNKFLHPYGRGSRYAGRWYKKSMLTLDHFAYQHLIRHYKSVFGTDSVHVFCYEEFAADAPGFAGNFALKFGLDVDPDKLSYNRRNESLCLFTAMLARLLGPFSRWDNPNRLVLLPLIPMWMHKAGIKAINKTVLRGPGICNRRLFGDRLYRELHNYFVKDNRILAEEQNLPLSGYGYPLEPIE